MIIGILNSFLAILSHSIPCSLVSLNFLLRYGNVNGFESYHGVLLKYRYVKWEEDGWAYEYFDKEDNRIVDLNQKGYYEVMLKYDYTDAGILITQLITLFG